MKINFKIFTLSLLFVMFYHISYSQIPPVRERRSTYVPMPYEEMKEALLMKQAAHDRAVRNCMSRVQEIYQAFNRYPTMLANAYYNVTVSSEADNVCEDAKVLVYEGKIVNFEWMDRDNGGRKVVFSSNIRDGKAIIKIVFPDGKTSGYFDTYFIEAISSLN